MSHAEQVRDGSVVRATAVFESIKQWLYQHETAQGELNGISLEVSPSTIHPEGASIPSTRRTRIQYFGISLFRHNISFSRLQAKPSTPNPEP